MLKAVLAGVLVLRSSDDNEGSLPWGWGASIHDEIDARVVLGQNRLRLATEHHDFVINLESNGMGVDCVETFADLIDFAIGREVLTKSLHINDLVALRVLANWHPHESRLGVIFGKDNDNSMSAWGRWYCAGKVLELLADESMDWVIFFEALLRAICGDTTFAAIFGVDLRDLGLTDQTFVWRRHINSRVLELIR
jgi:hypothetical protein